MEINAALVKELRDKSGAGILDCKEALKESNGDVEAAFDFLRKHGISKAAKKAHREVNEGAVLSYIHPGNKLGVLLELNCETDFVAKTEVFLELAKEVSMQIAASNPLTVTRDDISEQIVIREKEVYSGGEDLKGKPTNIVDKIIDGKMEKWYKQVCLMEQAFVKDPSKSISDLIKETISKLGENITIKRFARFQLGENA